MVQSFGMEKKSLMGGEGDLLVCFTDFCIAAPCSSLLGTVFFPLKAPGRGERGMQQCWASERALEALRTRLRPRGSLVLLQKDVIET